LDKVNAATAVIASSGVRLFAVIGISDGVNLSACATVSFFIDSEEVADDFTFPLASSDTTVQL